MILGLVSSACFFFFSARAESGASSAIPSSTATTTLPSRPRIENIFRFSMISSTPALLPLRQVLVTAGTELHVVGLVLHQQVGLRRRMRLVTRQAIELRDHLRRVARIDHIGYRVPLDRMAASVLQRQYHDLVLAEIVFWQLHSPVEDRDQVIGFQFLRRRRFRTVAL